MQKTGLLLIIFIAFIRRLAITLASSFLFGWPKPYQEQPAEGDGDGEGRRHYPDPPWVLQQSNQAVSTRDSYPDLATWTKYL
jgi:hypothetical protein